MALGGNALLQRGEKPDAGIQLSHVHAAAHVLAPLAKDHDLLVCNGNGNAPQVGMLAPESANDRDLTHSYPLDDLVAETQGPPSPGAADIVLPRKSTTTKGSAT